MFVCLTFVSNATVIHYKVSFEKKLKVDTLLADDGNFYSAVSLYDCIISDQEGAPNLPKKIITLIIPADEEADKIVLTKGKGEMISLSYPIIPVQKPIPTSLDFEGTEFVTPDNSIYEKNEYYPVVQANIQRTEGLRGNRVVVIEVTPVIYNPVLEQLEYFETLDINLHLKKAEKKLKTSKVKNKEKYDGYLKALVDNKADVDLYSVIEGQDTTSLDINFKSVNTTWGVSCEYIIITHSSLASYFNAFMAWKKQKGIDIKLVTTDYIFQHYPNGDLVSGIVDEAGSIRQFLKDCYDLGLEYALLGGDITKVPARYGTTEKNTWDKIVNGVLIKKNLYKISADLYFSDFEGDWAVDIDTFYGENSPDIVEFGPEIFVGRLLVNSGTQIQNWTNKLILYETNPGNGNTSYLRKAFFSEADQMQSDQQANNLVARFGSIFTTNTIYQEMVNGIPGHNSNNLPQFPTGNQVIAEMNTGYGFVSWANHASSKGFGVATIRWNLDCSLGGQKRAVTNLNSTNNTGCWNSEAANGLDNLNTSSKPFVLYSIGCETAPFDVWGGISPTANLAAQITNQSGKGGPIYFRKSCEGCTYYSYYMQQSFTSLISGDISHIGVAEAYSKVNSGWHHTRLAHNLIGCPETEMWTGTPSSLLSNSVIVYTGNTLYVSTGSISGCKICVMSSNDNGASYYDVRTTNYYCEDVPLPFTVTITKHNYFPYVKEVSSGAINVHWDNSQGNEPNCLFNPVSVYPNPVKSGLVNFGNLNFVDLKIYDETGKLLQSINLQGMKHYQLNVSKYPKGIYLYQLNSSDSDPENGKFIIE